MTSRKFSAAAVTSISTSDGPGGSAGCDCIDRPVICPGEVTQSW